MRDSKQTRRILIRNETRNTTIAEAAEIADTSATRTKGLLGRNTHPAGQALWIVPCSGIHTFGMRFAIDVVYLDRKLKIKKTRSYVRPWRLSMCLLADSVLELPAGTIDLAPLRRGDQLSLGK